MRVAIFTLFVLTASLFALGAVLQNDGSNINPGDHTDAIGIGSSSRMVTGAWISPTTV